MISASDPPARRADRPPEPMDGNPIRGQFGDEERISNPARIVGLLRGLKDGRALLSIAVDGDPALYTSAVLEVNPDHGYLLLDELSPHRGHQRLMKTRRLRVRARLHGIELRFPCAIREIGRASGIAYYYAPLPEQVRYRQRRTHFRVEIGAALIIPVHLTREPEETLDGALYDLSVGGVGAYVSKSNLKRGDTIPDCVVHIPDAPPLHSALEIRFVRFDEARRKLRIGGRFLNLARPQHKALKRFVAELERKLLQRRRHSRAP